MSALAELQQRALYKEYKRRIDVQAVLDHYGADNQREQVNADGTTEIIHSCLIDQVEPHHSNGDANPSACANIDKKVYICYQWWGGDIFHLIMKMERKETFAEILPVVQGFLSGAVQEGTDFAADLQKIFAGASSYTAELPSYSERVLQPWKTHPPHGYWETRGILSRAVYDLDLGYDPQEERLVFPHFFDGKLVGWQKRLTPTTNPQWPKYRNSLGFPKAETLYNYDIAKTYRNVVVVESPMSVARAYSLHFPAIVATFGAKVTAAQVELLRNFDRVTVWFDADDAGRCGEIKLVESLYQHTDVRVVIPEPGLDLADCDGEHHLVTRLLQAVPAALRRADYAREQRYGTARTP